MIWGFARRIWGFARRIWGFARRILGFCTKGFVVFAKFWDFPWISLLLHTFLGFHEEFRIVHGLLSCFPSICVVLAEV